MILIMLSQGTHQDVAGNDGLACLEFTYDKEMPEENDWIEVIGVIDIENPSTGEFYPVIRAKSVTIKSERGLEFVGN